MVPSVDTGEAIGGTANSPANDSNQSLTAILGGNEGTTRISLAGILSRVGGTDHVGGDAVVGAVALDVRRHRDFDLLQGAGSAAPAAKGAPAGDAGQNSCVRGAQVGWKACRAHFDGEIDRVCQTKDGVVVV